MITLSPVAIPFPIFAPPKLLAPILDRILLLPVPAIDDPDAARCDASFAITFEREMRGFRPGSAFGLIGRRGFW